LTPPFLGHRNLRIGANRNEPSNVVSDGNCTRSIDQRNAGTSSSSGSKRWVMGSANSPIVFGQPPEAMAHSDRRACKGSPTPAAPRSHNDPFGKYHRDPREGKKSIASEIKDLQAGGTVYARNSHPPRTGKVLGSQRAARRMQNTLWGIGHREMRQRMRVLGRSSVLKERVTD